MRLVTGSCGFMGRWLVEALKKRGEVATFDLQEGKSVVDLEQVLSCQKPQTIFHLAAISFVPDAAKDPYKTMSVNVIGTLNMLELARKHDAGFVFPSTYVYGPPQYLPVDEQHPVQAGSTYARSKLMGERLIEEYVSTYGLRATILRFFNIYGPGQDEKFLIPKIIAQLKKGHISLLDSRPRRDFTFVTDAVDAYLGAEEKSKGGIFNIGSGKSYSVKEVVELAQKVGGKKVSVEYAEQRRENEIPESVADAEKARRMLGWKAKVSLKEGLRRMLDA